MPERLESIDMIYIFCMELMKDSYTDINQSKINNRKKNKPKKTRKSILDNIKENSKKTKAKKNTLDQKDQDKPKDPKVQLKEFILEALVDEEIGTCESILTIRK